MKLILGSDFLATFPEKRLQDLERYELAAREIIQAVRAEGDSAVLRYTASYDGVELGLEQLLVTSEEIRAAYADVDDDYLPALQQAIDNVQDFHRRQLRSSWMVTSEDGSILGQNYVAIERAGIYVPGGTAPYPSSVLMNAVPARIAGVQEIVMTTPPGRNGKVNPYVLVAADRLGISCIYKAGGVQAIAALAYGTESLRPVDKIVGPGNIFVTVAKKLVYGQVDIDMLAGPSEVMVLADGTADPRFVAADLLSQAEHDSNACAVLVTDSKCLAEAVQVEVSRQWAALSRRDIAAAALEQNGAIVLVRDLQEGIKVVNHYAAEHLELLVENPFAILGQIRHAGAIFLGPWSPEPMGDYVAGPNHVLPTGGTARYYSGLGVDSYRKATNIIALSRQGFATQQQSARKLAEIEGLTAHLNAIRVRCE